MEKKVKNVKCKIKNEISEGLDFIQEWGVQMLIEMFFCIMFFVMPLVGMLITLLINGFQVEHADTREQSKSKAYISSQARARQIRREIIKIEDKHPNYFFKKWRNKYVKSGGFLDTS